MTLGRLHCLAIVVSIGRRWECEDVVVEQAGSRVLERCDWVELKGAVVGQENVPD